MQRILDAAAFTDVAFTDVREPVYYGPDVAAALKGVRGFTCTNNVLKRLDPVSQERAIDDLREMLAAPREQRRCLVRLSGLDR